MKKIMFMLLITIITIVHSGLPYPGNIDFEQSDGSTFTGKLKGDEWFNWIEDENGNIIKYNNSSKDYEEAKLIDVNGKVDLAPSGVKFIPAAPSEKRMSKSSAKVETTTQFSSPLLPKTIDASKKAEMRKALTDIWKRKRKESLPQYK